MSNPEEKLITFYLGDIHCGISLGKVKEIIPHMKSTAVPLAPPYIQGLINLRGKIITLLDFTKIFNSPYLHLEQSRYHMLLKQKTFLDLGLSPTDRFAFSIDSIGDVLSYTEDDLESPPANLGALDQRWMSAVIKRPEGVVAILNLTQILKESLHLATHPKEPALL
jgi:purine-binding chemotaxis protein CheW